MLDSPEPSLHHIAVRLGDTAARAVVSYLLAEALEFFNVRETMNDRQVALTVDLILEEYPYLKTDDLKLCLRRAMKLCYGELYNRIDGQVILGWLRAYNRERCSEADRQSYNEHKAHLAQQALPTEGLFYQQYRDELQRKAASGDAEALRRLELSDELQERIRTLHTLSHGTKEDYRRSR